jgi:hypothetical protein
MSYYGRKLLHTSQDGMSLPTTWVCKDGTKVKIIEMSDSHLLNTHRMIVRKWAPLRSQIMNFHTMPMTRFEATEEALLKEIKKRKLKPLVRLCGCMGGYEVPLDYGGEALEHLIGQECNECDGHGYVDLEKNKKSPAEI